MVSCQDDNVVFRFCGEGSRFKIEDQKHCVGPQRKISKTDFRNFINAQLDKTELHDKLGAITKEDIKASRSTGNLSDAKSCEAQIEGEIADLRNKLSQLQGAISQAVKADIEGQIKSQEGALVGAKAKTKACENKQAALKKIETQIENAVNTVCARNGIYVPQEGSFLHSVLSQYDPSKHPCSTEKDCNTSVKLANGTVVGALVSRSVNDKGVVKEFVKDKASKLTWSPEAPTTMNHRQAIAYCAAKKDLGLKWSLPSDEDFRVAFNPQNPNYGHEPYNKNLLEALDTKDRFLWSRRVGEYFRGGFNGSRGNISSSVYDNEHSVRCVGR
jgi:hypothetical protein